jgi:hypothetical protein
MILCFFLRMIDRNAAVAIPQFYCLAINEFARGSFGFIVVDCLDFFGPLDVAGGVQPNAL